MKLISDWKDVAKRAHSMWAFYLSVAALIAPDLMVWLFERDTNPRVWWFIALVLLIYGIVGRLKDQDMDRTKMRASIWGAIAALFMTAPADVPVAPMPPPTEAAFLEVAVPHVGKWEGLRTTAYLDRIASPPVWTVCYGETRGVKQGDTYTVAECDRMLGAGLLEYRAGLHAYFTSETIDGRLTAERDAAYVSLAWNAGIRAAGKSTATRRLNAGNIAGGCEALTWWNKAGGRVIRGLVNRRADDYELCMVGLA